MISSICSYIASSIPCLNGPANQAPKTLSRHPRQTGQLGQFSCQACDDPRCTIDSKYEPTICVDSNGTVFWSWNGPPENPHHPNCQWFACFTEDKGVIPASAQDCYRDDLSQGISKKYEKTVPFKDCITKGNRKLKAFPICHDSIPFLRQDNTSVLIPFIGPNGEYGYYCPDSNDSAIFVDANPHTLSTINPSAISSFAPTPSIAPPPSNAAGLNAAIVVVAVAIPVIALAVVGVWLSYKVVKKVAGHCERPQIPWRASNTTFNQTTAAA